MLESVPAPTDLPADPAMPESPATTPPAAAPALEQPPAALPPTEPATQPDDVEDLFQDPTPMPSEPATQPADDVENLFQDPAPAADAPAADPTDAVEDLFQETPATPPAETPAAPDDGVDDLFRDTNASPSKDSDLESLFSDPTEETRTSEEQPDEIKSLQDEVDKLFSEPTDGAANDRGDGMRTWTDNTGKYHTRARLVSVTATHVRLLKDNNRYTTVPIERLSRGDLAYARQHAGRAIVASF